MRVAVARAGALLLRGGAWLLLELVLPGQATLAGAEGEELSGEPALAQRWRGERPPREDTKGPPKAPFGLMPDKSGQGRQRGRAAARPAGTKWAAPAWGVRLWGVAGQWPNIVSGVRSQCAAGAFGEGVALCCRGQSPP